MNVLVPKQYNFSNVKGLSYKQLSEHYELYTGYVKSVNTIRQDLKEESIYTNTGATYSKLRCAVKGNTYALDGVYLHQLYFENLTGNNTMTYGTIEKLILRKYGSNNKFIEIFSNTGLSVRGWVTLSYNECDNDICIYGQDSHDDGVVVNTFPLIVLDVYEHAYMIDYGIDRKKYINVFFNNLDYKVVNDRIKKIIRY